MSHHEMMPNNNNNSSSSSTHSQQDQLHQQQNEDSSVISDQSGAMQTRFSFYNAQDFVAEEPQPTAAAAAAATSEASSSSLEAAAATTTTSAATSPKRNTAAARAASSNAAAAAAASAAMTNLDDCIIIAPPSPSHDGNIVTTSAETQQKAQQQQAQQHPDEQQQQQQQHLHHRDSAEILKSLQEHEQQRLEILAGPSTSTRSQKQQQQQQQQRQQQQAAAGGGSGGRSRTTAAAGGSETTAPAPHTTSNPYEDAIKEALDLLRKHRTTNNNNNNNATAVMPLASAANHANLPPPAPAALSPRSPAGIGTTPMGTFLPSAAAVATTTAPSTNTTPLSLLQHPTFQQQQGSDPGSGGADGGDGESFYYYYDDNDNNDQNDDGGANRNSNAPNHHLGETYQAEIEARRKQRQERMARYASRLAELKQESDQKQQQQQQQQASNSTNYSSSDAGAPTSSSGIITSSALAAAMGAMNISTSSNGVGGGGGAIRGRSSGGNHNSSSSRAPRVDTTSLAAAWEDADSATNMASGQYSEQDFSFPHSSRSAPPVMDSATFTTTTATNGPAAAAVATIAECHVGSSTSTGTGISAVSNRTGNNSTEEEVQRGVERVLLAILERAHSQGRANGASESNSNNNSALQQQNRQQPSQQTQQLLDASEEKKCYDDAHQQHQQQVAVSAAAKQDEENSLARAMSDLLGMPSSTSTLGSWSSTRQAFQHVEQQQQYQHQYQQIQQQQPPPHEHGDHRRKNQHDATRPAPLLIVRSNASAGGDALVELSSTEGQLSIQESRRQPLALAIKENSTTGAAIEPVSSSDALAPPGDARDGVITGAGGARVQNQRHQDSGGAARGRMNESDALDEMVRQVLKREEAGCADQEIQADSSNEHDDSLDRRVRGVVSQEGNIQGEEASDSASTIDDDIATRSRSEDETIRSSNEEGDDLDESSVAIDNVSYENDDDHSEDDDHAVDLDGVLGPLSEKAGGTTGIVLEPDSPSQREGGAASPSILVSLSAAMSLVAGNASSEGKIDKYASQERDYEEDEESSELMRTLCAHLLPVGVTNQSNKLLDKLPEWDESNPDEAGYRIIRLTTQQLASVEHAFEGMVNSLKQNSERCLVGATGSDEAFERDLQTAEELLNREEMRKQEEADKALASDGTTYSLPPATGEQFDGPGSGIVFARELKESDLLPEFPGVKPTGRGEMGDLEFFHLPIIFKSHVTGFEPTKDLFLEAGNIVAGQYLVAGELGSAAFSTAYRCVDLNSEGDGPDGHDEVCLKVIKNTKDFFDQSLDEIKILELLRQTGRCPIKNIVEMKTFFYHREHLVIVTELLRQNLFEFGKFILDNDEEPYFTMLRLSFITRQVLIALEFVHKLGLVHCDVKPENILLSSYSRAQVKLIDFGSSCFLTDRQSSYIQSRSYRAPEVVLGLPYDGRIDIWSLGCVVAEMFTGEVTFQNDSIVSMLSRIEAICGPFPRHMIAQGRQSGRFFAKCGLLYEKVAADEKEDDGGESQTSDEDEETSERSPRFVDVFQPKVTSLSSRLGFAPDLMEKYDSGEKLTKDENWNAIFVDFVRKLLTIDPEARPTATEALDHPWTRLAASLTEEDIKYPSSSSS